MPTGSQLLRRGTGPVATYESGGAVPKVNVVTALCGRRSRPFVVLFVVVACAAILGGTANAIGASASVARTQRHLCGGVASRSGFAIGNIRAQHTTCRVARALARERLAGYGSCTGDCRVFHLTALGIRFRCVETAPAAIHDSCVRGRKRVSWDSD